MPLPENPPEAADRVERLIREAVRNAGGRPLYPDEQREIGRAIGDLVQVAMRELAADLRHELASDPRCSACGAPHHECDLSPDEPEPEALN